MPTLTTDWSDADVSAELDFCDTIGCDDPTVPLQVWANESDNKAGAHNPNGDASGIFQLMPETAKGLGYPLSGDPHLANFRALGVAGQLKWAVRYYGAHAGKVNTVGEFYTCTFLPALLDCAKDLQFILCGQRGPLAWAYQANQGFDVGRRGFITVQDLVDAAQRATGPRTRELIARVLAAKAARAPTDPAPAES
jgi:hypothetical protein